MVCLIQLEETNNRNPIIIFTGSPNSLQALPLSAAPVSLFQTLFEYISLYDWFQQVFHRDVQGNNIFI